MFCVRVYMFCVRAVLWFVGDPTSLARDNIYCGLPGSPCLSKTGPKSVRIICTVSLHTRLEASALHSCPHATVSWSPMVGGTRQYISIFNPVCAQWRWGWAGYGLISWTKIFFNIILPKSPWI